MYHFPRIIIAMSVSLHDQVSSALGNGAHKNGYYAWCKQITGVF